MQDMSNEAILLAMEEFAQKAIRMYHAQGVKLGLFITEDYNIIMDAIGQEAAKKVIEELQKHFDEHFDKGETCNDLVGIEKMFNLTTGPDGHVTVVSRKEEKEGMN